MFKGWVGCVGRAFGRGWERFGVVLHGLHTIHVHGLCAGVHGVRVVAVDVAGGRAAPLNCWSLCTLLVLLSSGLVASCSDVI